jgi:hypothetical protein
MNEIKLFIENTHLTPQNLFSESLKLTGLFGDFLVSHCMLMGTSLIILHCLLILIDRKQFNSFALLIYFVILILFLVQPTNISFEKNWFNRFFIGFCSLFVTIKLFSQILEIIYEKIKKNIINLNNFK